MRHKKAGKAGLTAILMRTPQPHRRINPPRSPCTQRSRELYKAAEKLSAPGRPSARERCPIRHRRAVMCSIASAAKACALGAEAKAFMPTNALPVPSFGKAVRRRRRTRGCRVVPPRARPAGPAPFVGARSEVSRPRAQIRLTGKLPVWRQPVDHTRKVPGELRKQIILRGTRLARKIVDGFLPERVAQLVGRDRLVLPGADPGVDHVLKPALLELIDEDVEAPG